MSRPFKLDPRQQLMVALAEKAAEQAHAIGHHAPNELAKRMTSEAESTVQIAGPPNTPKSPQATLAAAGKHLVGRVPTMGEPLNRHGAQDLQSLLMHLEAVRLLTEKPSLATRLKQMLRRWRRRRDTNSDMLLARWEKIVERRDWDTALSDTEQAQQLRQSSPLTALLSEESRLAIISAIRALREAERSSGGTNHG